MMRPLLRRAGAIFLALVLLNGAGSRAYGLALCPMHAATEQAEHSDHQEHAGQAAEHSSPCDCLDACQSGCSVSVPHAPGIATLFGASAVERVEMVEPLTGIRALLQSHVLPFATAPPLA
jgi:hypothetical protein